MILYPNLLIDALNVNMVLYRYVSLNNFQGDKGMKERLFATVLIISVLLAGCANVQDLTDQDNEIISQYIAGVVLNSSDRYGHSFNYDKSVLKPTPKPTQTPPPAPDTDGQGNGGTPGTGSHGNGGSTGSKGNGGSGVSAAKSVKLDQIYGITGINVKPGTVETKKHISTSYSSIAADKGKKLVIVSFVIKNNSSKAARADFAKKNISYSITIGGKNFGTPMLTIAEGDLLSFNEKIPAGGSKKGILVFQADSSVKVKDVTVRAARDNKESVFNVN